MKYVKEYDGYWRRLVGFQWTMRTWRVSLRIMRMSSRNASSERAARKPELTHHAG